MFPKKKNGGYALLTALMFFLGVSAAVIFAISDAVFRETRIARNESLSKQSYLLAESGAEDVAYRIKKSYPYDATETYVLGASSAVVTETLAPSGVREISSVGDVSNTKRKLSINLNSGNEIAFRYALQSGLGGIDLGGGAHITGDIYTTGSIRGCGTCNVLGNAVAAGKSTSALDQDNSLPTTPAQSISFGATNSTQDLSQSFVVSTDLSLVDLEVYIKKVGNPANATIRITTDNAGKPSGTILASGTLSSALVTTSYAWLGITLTANPLLTTGSTYWIVIDGNTSASNYYIIGANSSYGSGQAKVGRYSSNSWNATSPAGLDSYFKLYIGENYDGITGFDLWNPIPVSSSYSYEATYVNSTGAIYCQIGTGNNKSCDTTRGDPSIEAFPIADATIAAWKADALVNIFSGNKNVGFAGATLGPMKIQGNLAVSSGGTLDVSGTIWVTGNLTIDGGATIRPANSAKSYAIVVDGTITLSGGALITGNTGSHILLVSMSVADPAITINGGANDTVVFAPNGGLLISGGAEVNAAAARHITALGGSNIIYDPDVSKLNVISGSSGITPFEIKSWKETQ